MKTKENQHSIIFTFSVIFLIYRDNATYRLSPNSIFTWNKKNLIFVIIHELIFRWDHESARLQIKTHQLRVHTASSLACSPDRRRARSCPARLSWRLWIPEVAAIRLYAVGWLSAAICRRERAWRRPHSTGWRCGSPKASWCHRIRFLDLNICLHKVIMHWNINLSWILGSKLAGNCCVWTSLIQNRNDIQIVTDKLNWIRWKAN